MDGMPEGEQGFRVTPGEALTDFHASGTMNMSAYGTVALSLPEEAVTRLTLGDVELDATLANGGSFTVELQEDVLILSPEDDAGEWVINALTLKTLARSGIAALELRLGGETISIPTDLEFSGRSTPPIGRRAAFPRTLSCTSPRPAHRSPSPGSA